MRSEASMLVIEMMLKRHRPVCGPGSVTPINVILSHNIQQAEIDTTGPAARRCKSLDADDVCHTKGNGAPDRIRTYDLCLRRAALYPAELRVRAPLLGQAAGTRNGFAAPKGRRVCDRRAPANCRPRPSPSWMRSQVAKPPWHRRPAPSYLHWSRAARFPFRC